MNTAVKDVLAFIKHPGTNTGLGLLLVALSQFTATVPSADRNPNTIIGLSYVIATLFIEKFTPKSA